MAKFIMRIAKKHIKEMISYGFWGGITTIINLFLFYFFIELGMFYLLSNILSYFIAVGLSYYFNIKFVFKTGETNKRILEVIKYILVRIASIVIDSGLLWIMVSIMGDNVYFSKIFVSAIVILITYLFNKFWVFKEGKKCERI